MGATDGTERSQQILTQLSIHYQGASTALVYQSPFELLVAVVLSAQCTDERVNRVTARLFPAYNTPAKMAALTQPELETLIRDCGLFRTKAKNLLLTCAKLQTIFAGEVPRTQEALMTLPGVGRKTANVLVSHLYHVPAIAVDTHVFRTSHRLGLASGATPEAVEQELMAVIPQQDWSDAHHWLIWHGRKVCHARKPACPDCFLVKLCPYDEKTTSPV